MEKKARLLVVLAAFRVGSGNRLLVDLAAYCEMVLNQSTGYLKFYITQKKSQVRRVHPLNRWAAGRV